MSCSNETGTKMNRVTDTRTMKQKLNDAVFNEEKEHISNMDLFMVADIDNLSIFYHEAVWAKFNKSPIPTGKLVFHKDGDPLNNDPENLDLTDENEHGDFHRHDDKIFHVQNYENKKEFIKTNFEDVYEALFKQ